MHERAREMARRDRLHVPGDEVRALRSVVRHYGNAQRKADGIGGRNGSHDHIAD